LHIGRSSPDDPFSDKTAVKLIYYYYYSHTSVESTQFPRDGEDTVSLGWEGRFLSYIQNILKKPSEPTFVNLFTTKLPTLKIVYFDLALSGYFDSPNYLFNIRENV